ncbi:hypothetical protein RB195_011875 [Necator americanus]|uniref:Serpentine receptor class gamma n=1 Tax=Necator americanus TaxID=51031 RepID=A0ABR1D5D8_NECAM
MVEVTVTVQVQDSPFLTDDRTGTIEHCSGGSCRSLEEKLLLQLFLLGNDARFGPWILALLASLIAVSTTVVVVKVGSMKRSYINGLGYFDYSPSSVALTVANYCSIVISLLSIGLHVFIYLWMKKIRSTFVHSKTHTTGRAERLMSLQVVLIATFELLFLLLFIVIPLINIGEYQTFFVISLYNILSSIPELLIPGFVLLSSKDLLLSLARIAPSIPSTKTKTVS